jgi:uncharacterized protein YycO
MAKLAFRAVSDTKFDFIEIVMGLVSNGVFFHCEIIFENGAVGYSSKDTGVVLKNIQDRNYTKDWFFYEIPCSEKQEQKIKEWFIQNQNLKYNWTGILGNMITGLSLDFTGGQFCSQSCFSALTTSGVMKDYGFVPSEISPSDLQLIIQKLNWKLCQN